MFQRINLSLFHSWLIYTVILTSACSSLVSAQEGTECPDGPATMPISYGDLIICQIEEIGDSDAFSFTGNASDKIILQVAEVPGFGEPCIEVFSPDNSPLNSECEINDPRIDLTLGVTGNYTVLISDQNDDETLSYNLALERYFPEVDSGTDICPGCILENQLAPLGDLDFFKFTGSAGDMIIVKAAEIPGFGEPCMEIFQPNGSLLNSQCEINNPRIDFTLGQSGIHAIMLYDQNNDEGLSHNLIIERKSPLSCTAEYLCFGCNDNGSITPIGDIDVFYFTGTQNDRVILTVSEIPSFGEPCFELFSPSGALVTEEPICDINNAEFDQTLTDSGLYTIFINDENDDETFNYDIDIQCIGQCDSNIPVVTTWCPAIFNDGFESLLQ